METSNDENRGGWGQKICGKYERRWRGSEARRVFGKATARKQSREEEREPWGGREGRREEEEGGEERSEGVRRRRPAKLFRLSKFGCVGERAGWGPSVIAPKRSKKKAQLGRSSGSGRELKGLSRKTPFEESLAKDWNWRNLNNGANGNFGKEGVGETGKPRGACPALKRILPSAAPKFFDFRKMFLSK